MALIELTAEALDVQKPPASITIAVQIPFGLWPSLSTKFPGSSNA
jgi:hypothetical protein